DLRKEVKALVGNRSAPLVDFSNASLYSQEWSGVDFSWLAGSSFVGVDLRGAILDSSRWGTERGTTLRNAYMQCAFLPRADFTDHAVILQDADLRGADLTGANLA